MDHTHFPWRPLGALLVAEGLVTADQLEQALAEQRRSGRLLGQILVGRSYLTGFTLARILAEQHGVALRPSRSGTAASAGLQDSGSTHADAGRVWRPLGKLLVEKGFLTETELDEALAEQREHGGRLGEILVTRDYLSGPRLARALAERHGVEVGKDAFAPDLQTVIAPPTPGQPVYHVCEVVADSSFETRSILYESVNFLEAADFACEFVEDHEPGALEIQRIRGEARETVWMYSESRAAEEAASRKRLVETFGFDPTIWDAGSRLDRG